MIDVLGRDRSLVTRHKRYYIKDNSWKPNNRLAFLVIVAPGIQTHSATLARSLGQETMTIAIPEE